MSSVSIQRQELREEVMDVFGERLVPGHAHHALGGLDGERRVGCDLERQLAQAAPITRRRARSC